MRCVWLGLKFRMELNPHHEGVIGDFDNLNQSAIGVGSGNSQSFVFERIAIPIVEFVTMAVALADLRFSHVG